MATFHDLEAVRRAGEPGSVAMVKLTTACDVLKELALMEVPVEDLVAARDAITRAIHEVASTR